MKQTDPSKLRAVRLLVSTSFRADPWRSIASILLELAFSSGDLLSIYASKLVVDAATAGRVDDAVRAGIGAALAVAVSHAARSAGASVTIGLRERTVLSLDSRILELVSGLPGLQHHERPELLDRIELLRQERWALGASVNSLLNHIGVVVQLLATIVLLSAVHPILLLLPASMAIPVKIARVIDRLGAGASEKAAEPYRLATRLEAIARDPAVAGEVRMHAIGPLLAEHHERANAAVSAARREVALKIGALDVFWNAVLTFTQIGAVAFVALRAVWGGGTAGDVLLVVGLVLRIGRQLNGLTYGLEWLLTNLRAVGRLAWLIDEAAEAARDFTPSEPVPPPDRLRTGIALEDVAFTYPGTETQVLRGVSVTLPAGSTVALVGENGAGKSTLVKLLCGLYRPTSGRITADGVDLSAVPVGAWRDRLSGAFQDFARLDLLVREVVGVGDLARMDDPSAVDFALRRAGGEAVVQALPRGWDTQLGTSFVDGVEPSGGQWQQLALGRGMMRPEPLLLVLDEPTAALHPETEARLFERYAEGAARAAERTGAITLLVSHRFSTVRMADLIVVLEGGRVLESGTHSELVGAGGLYAELYELQARAYR